VIEAKGWLQAMVVTAHQAMGSLVVGVSVWLMVLKYRPALGEAGVRTAGVNLTGCAET
jgi:hypothetical protein